MKANYFLYFFLIFAFHLIKCDLILRAPKELQSTFISKYKFEIFTFNIDGTIKTGLANFGKISYGHKMEGYLLYDVNNEQNQYGCEKFDKYTEENPAIGDSPFIILKKGLCSVTRKVINVEKAGGHAAIIINDKDEPPEQMFLADDGQGSDISIPAVLIGSTDGNKLIDYYKNNPHDKAHRIRLEIHFLLEKSDNTVKYDIWFTPDQENVYSFLKDFERYQKLLGDTAILGMHYVTYPYFSYNPNSNSPVEDCLGGGLYCVRPGNTITDGSLIALESIKQKCIYKYTYENKEKINGKQYFWDYMIKFYEKCIYQQEIYDKLCSENIISLVGIQKNVIDQCITDSFIGTSTGTLNQNTIKILKNKILDEEYETRKNNYITRVPSLTINGRLYDGSWRPEYIFDALCASLNKKPKVCFTEGTQIEAQGFSGPAVFLIILVVLAINIILFILCKNYIKNKIIDRIESTDINSKIDAVVNSYIALRDQS